MNSFALDRSTPPTGQAVHPVTFPRPRRFRLANGMTLLASRSRRAPLAAVELITPGGSQHNPLHRPGLATLTAALLDEGTEQHSGRQIAEQVERLGGGLDCGALWDLASLAIDLPAAELLNGLDLLAEMATCANFPQAEFERVRRQRQAEILQRRNLPGALADQHLVAAIYGTNSPYGYPPIGTVESLGALRRDDLVRFYRHHIGVATGTTLIVVGDFEPEWLFTEVERRFAALPERPPESSDSAAAQEGANGHRRIATPAALAPTVVIVDRPGGAQTALRVGHHGVPRSHPDYLALSVMSTLLGGKFTSRLNLNLRERHGFTYGVHSIVTGRHGPGPIFVTTDVATDVAGAATGEIFTEIHRIRDQAVTCQELEETRNYLIGTFPNVLQSLTGIAGRLETIAIHNLSDDYFDGYLATLATIDSATIQRVAQRHLAPDHAVTIAVGPADQLVPQLETFGSVRVVKNPS